MALSTNLPPQAYTRDILVKAIEWLSTQPASMRERASSADLIVSYYLQASRRGPLNKDSHGNDNLNFKHLAQDLKQFEVPSAPPQPVRSQTSNFPSADLQLMPPPEPIFRSQMKTEAPPPPPQLFKAEAAPVPSIEPEPETPQWPIDERSMGVARDLCGRLNLGSEIEALRLLITLGAERARELFP